MVMTCKIVLLSALSLGLLAGTASAAELPIGRWYKVDNYRCRAFRDFVDDRASVIGTQLNVSQRSCAILCNGTPNCAAYNYILRVDRSRGRPRPAIECQLLNSADRPVSVFAAGPGESAYVCYKDFPPDSERPDLETDARRSFQDSLRPSAPPPPPAPPRTD
jgi:hypothetical protein